MAIYLLYMSVVMDLNPFSHKKTPYYKIVEKVDFYWFCSFAGYTGHDYDVHTSRPCTFTLLHGQVYYTQYIVLPVFHTFFFIFLHFTYFTHRHTDTPR